MHKVNLLQETIQKLEEHERSSEDVLWVGSGDGKYAISWAEFAELADQTYTRDYNGQLVAKDLVVVGDKWWLKRKEYDGGEWWQFVIFPEKAIDPSSFDVLLATEVKHRGWLSIANLQQEKNKLSLDAEESQVEQNMESGIELAE